MTSITAAPTAISPYRPGADSDPIPPLENGDRLTLRDFMRRYEAMPHVKKAELIEGTVIMAAAVRVPHHGSPHIWLGNVISTYAMSTRLDCADNSTVELDSDNAPQPDLLMFLPPELGGRAKVNDNGYLEGPPDLVAEIAASTASIDLHGKLRAYQTNGVQEYVVWRVLDAAVDWFVLQDAQFVPLAPDEHGIYRSRVFPGLWLNVPALLRQDAQQLWATLDAGMSTDDYRAFATKVKEVVGQQRQ